MMALCHMLCQGFILKKAGFKLQHTLMLPTACVDLCWLFLRHSCWMLAGFFRVQIF